jgi:gluconolactonase
MKNFISLIFFLIILNLFTGCGDNKTESPGIEKNDTTMVAAPQDHAKAIEILDPEALTLLDSTTKLEVIANGFTWTEGPLYIADGDYLLFSDIPNNKVYKWKEGKDTSVYLYPSGFTGMFYNGKERGSNALLLNKNKELILLQHGDRRVAKMKSALNYPRPDYSTLADKYEGKMLNSPNDGVFAADGSLYFTDPPYGLANGIKDSSKQLPFQGVFILRPNGKLELFTDEIKYPNGITLSPGGKFLYVANSDPENKIWMQYELDDKGKKKSGKIFYHAKEDDGKDNGNPDGMKMNRQGYLFAAGPAGIWLFNTAGKLIARIYTGGLTSNCAFGKNEKELFITSGARVMRVKLK